ncbi:MAG: hypothetical protein HDS92_02995 [Bacteroidales bacterium]|nr:hypothetical protein [Bacteroidales bacterium]MBD5376642.1 hypothetical protein [Bacteroides sp.]
MDQETRKHLGKDPDGLLTYEYIANHIGLCDDDMPLLVDNMIAVDSTGQFMVSAARYLGAIDAVKYQESIARLVAMAIERDRERRYIGDLLTSLWGPDYLERAEALSSSDDNFRRIFKRIHPSGLL